MKNYINLNQKSRFALVGAALALETLLFIPASAATAWYHATVLPQLDPVISQDKPATTTGHALNNLSLVVGNYGLPEQGFLWTSSFGALPLKGLFGWDRSTLKAASDNAVAGAFSTRGEAYRPFVFTFGQQAQVLPKLIEDPRLAGEATAVSDTGWVVGRCEVAPPRGTFSGPAHAVVWKNGTVTDLGTLGGENSGARSVNNAGVVVGNSAESNSLVTSAFRWEAKRGMERLQRIQDNHSTYAYDINEAGIISGAVETTIEGSGNYHTAVTWGVDGRPAMLPYVLPGSSQTGFRKYTDALALNRYGEIVGQEFNMADFSSSAVLWVNRQGYLLQDVVEGLPPGLHLNAAVDINNKGEILANGYNPATSQFSTVLLTPIFTVDSSAGGILNSTPALEVK